MSTTHTTFATDGPMAVLTFNRPEARNAMTWDMYQAVIDACERADDDGGVHVLILRGAGGKAFVAGTDIAQFERFRTAQDALEYEARIDQVLDRLERVTKATIAQVEGVAVGGGCSMALACDLRVATPASTFGIPIARTLGNCVSAGMCSRFVDLVGPGRVKELLFTGRLLDAAEAHSLGLVTRIADSEAIDRIVRELALAIAANAPLTIRATKEMVRRLMAKRRLQAGDDRDLIELCYMSADFREGVEAFLAKRKPQWTGR